MLNMKKSLSFLIALVFIGAGLTVLYRDNQQKDADTETGFKTFESELGISFEYSDIYFLETRELGDGHSGHLLIMLTEDTEENRLVREGKTPPREGPTAITFELFQSPDESEPLLWITENQESNYRLGNGIINEMNVAGKIALTYHWSGLYEGDSIVFKNRDYIVFGSVTYLTPEDKIRTDFNGILKTITLD